MRQDLRFSEALLHVRHRICGRRLRPFCAAYAAALVAVDSPLLSDEHERRITPEDLLYALEVCSSVVDPQTLTPAAVMRPRRRSFDLSRRLLYRLSSVLFRKALSRWIAYYRDYVSEPQQMEPVDFEEGSATAKSSGQVTGPYYLARVCSVLKQYGSVDEYRAWTMPLGMLVWMDEQGKELDGAGRPFWDEAKAAEIDEALAQAEAKGHELLKA